MKIGRVSVFLVLIAAWFVFGLSWPAHAAPPQQQFATNTALPDGRIIYKVQPGDTCTKIQLLYSINLQLLRELNQNINADCTNIIAGEELLVGTGGPAAAASATPGPSPTAAPATVTPTPFAGTTEICVLLFDDLNGDALREANEPAIAGGAISVTEITGKYSKTLQTTINPDPTAYPGTCFNDVPEGKYNIAAAIPDNYNPTISLTYTMDMQAGQTAFVAFGAQARDAAAAQPGPGQQSGGTYPLLGIFGGALLLGGLGLGWYAIRLRAPQGKLRRSGLLRR
jgi:murein DD-endopeptidase MepM/ murein hydrolase activator NlpD